VSRAPKNEAKLRWSFKRISGLKITRKHSYKVWDTCSE